MCLDILLMHVGSADLFFRFLFLLFLAFCTLGFLFWFFGQLWEIGLRPLFGALAFWRFGFLLLGWPGGQASRLPRRMNHAATAMPHARRCLFCGGFKIRSV
jgi:hypothetical protein